MKNNIKVLRALRGITQQQLADAIGVRRETLIRIEKGAQNFGFDTAIKITEVLKCSLDDLIKEITI